MFGGRGKGEEEEEARGREGGRRGVGDTMHRMGPRGNLNPHSYLSCLETFGLG